MSKSVVVYDETGNRRVLKLNEIHSLRTSGDGTVIRLDDGSSIFCEGWSTFWGLSNKIKAETWPKILAEKNIKVVVDSTYERAPPTCVREAAQNQF